MNSVSSLIDLKDQLTYEQKIAIKSLGPPRPKIVFEGKRQCNLSEQYNNHPWICGCPDRKAFFCFPCLILKPHSLSCWTTNGAKDLKNLSNLRKQHERTQDHVSASASFALLGVVNITYALNYGAIIQRNQHNDEVKLNRELLHHHIDVAIFLIQQGLAFRGHDESSDSLNKGNFVEGMRLLCKYSDNKMLKSIVNDGGVFTGLTSDIQNDIIHSIYTVLMCELKQRVKCAEFISIMADDTTDLSNSSQFGVCMRIVHEGLVYEHLIDLCEVSSDRTAAHLTDILVSSLKEQMGIDETTVIVGQSYDGASNMAGCNNSVSQRMKEKWPFAHFTHCYAHKWALVSRQACAGIQKVSILLVFSIL
jgi:hypothetical protein